MKNIYIYSTFLALFLTGTLDANSQSNHTENKEINSLIKKKRKYNKTNGAGFIIQLYNGSESRARSIRNNFKSDFRGVRTRLLYEAPDWKTQVGNYRTRLDADKALNTFREKYAGGIIIEN